MSVPFVLNDEQLAYFDTFGFLSFPRLLSDKTDRISNEFEQVWSERGGGHNGELHDGEKRSCIVPFIDQSTYLSTLLDDPRIVGIATSLLGADFNYMGSDGNYYAGDTVWHSDGFNKVLRHVKIAFYLDPLTADTGALRVMPGSHKIEDTYALALEKLVRESDTHLGVSGQQIPAIALETQPGDIVCFQHNTKHAAFGGGGRRRMFTINLSQRYPDDMLVDLRKYLEAFSRYWVDRPYSEVMINTAGPERHIHLEQIMANDSHVAALSAKARQTMSEPSRG
jgi:hypothetical protein